MAYAIFYTDGPLFFFGPKKTPPFLTLLKIKMYNRFSLEYHPPPHGGVRKKKGGVSTKDGHFRQVNSREWRRKGFNFIELRFWVAYVIFYGNEPLFFYVPLLSLWSRD
jgi:hypothetical protein